MDRRAFLLLAAAALPLAMAAPVGPASAALKIPTKVPPPRVRPLGTWKLLDRRPSVEVGPFEDVVALVELEFRSAIDAAEPYINFWPGRLPVPPLPSPPTPIPNVPNIPTPFPIDPIRRPQERPFDEPLFSGLVVPVAVEIPVARNTCAAGYRITVQMSDGPTDDATIPANTRRRSTFSFVLTVVGNPCYVSRVSDPELPAGRPVAVRPTSKPHTPARTGIDRSAPAYLTRLAMFRTPTP